MRSLSGVLLLFSIISSLPPASAVSSNPTPDCSAGSTCTVTFGYTGDYYTWTAPNSGSIKLEVWGAQGGGGAGAYVGTGGAGGYAAGNYTISSGATLYIYVGQQGIQTSSTVAFNGGGTGNPSASYGNGFSGGGATHIATSVGFLSNLSSNKPAVLIVAGGGGGASGCYAAGCYSGWSIYAVNGGAGGGATGVDGVSYSTRYGGTGGTSSAGGTSTGASTEAAFGSGANSSLADSDAIQGGGGGGGWYGGGAGTYLGGGGGGGSGYVGTLTSTTLTAGNATMPNPSGGTMTGRTGHGLARITYTAIPATVSLSLAGNPTTATKGQAIALTANVNYAGLVTFYADGKKIAGCISMATSAGSKTCNWKPTVQKSVKITVDFLQSGAGSRITSQSFMLVIVKRVNTR